MKWNIIHKNLNKSAIVSNNNYLSIGNNSENDILLETKSTKNLFYQFFLDNGFIYFEHENKKNVYYLKNHFFLLIFEAPELVRIIQVDHSIVRL